MGNFVGSALRLLAGVVLFSAAVTFAVVVIAALVALVDVLS